MSARSHFVYDRFLSLDGLALASYMEPLVNDPTAIVDKAMLERVLSQLSTYDEDHLVYGLALGAAHSPQTFAQLLPQYLAHEEASVCCTAVNALNSLPAMYITQDLCESAQSTVSLYPVRDFVREVPETLRKRMLNHA